jgi:peptidoglycan/xylan/chitin deacetylase (PgdA/CDA1 family)
MLLRGCPVLAYHQITKTSSGQQGSPLAIPVDRFERQMRYLHEQGYTCVPLFSTLAWLNQPAAVPQKSFVLTFDDGYTDFLENAAPILARYQFTATVFLVSGRLGGKTDWEGESGHDLLTLEQVKELQGRGIQFGSHSCTHPRLTRLSADEMNRELACSKEDLESSLGQEVQALAYPFGESNPVVQSVAERVGYKAAYGISKGRSGPYNIWRYMVFANDRLPEFALQVAGWHQYWNEFREDSSVGRSLRHIKQGVMGRLRTRGKGQ